MFEKAMVLVMNGEEVYVSSMFGDILLDSADIVECEFEDAIEEEQPVEQKRTLEDWLYSNKIKIAAGLSAIFFIGTMCGYILTSSILDSAYQEHLQHKIQTSIGRK